MLINRGMSREQAYIHVAPEVLEEVSEEDKEEIREAIKIARSGEPTIPPQQAARQTAFEEADQRYTPLPSTPRKPRKVSANKYRSLLESDEQLNARQSQQKSGLENLLSHHRDTMTSGTFEVTDEGRTHTLWSTLHKEAPNLWRLIPGFWDGERVSEEEAYRRAKEEGISNYPAFKSREEAMAADAILHEEIEEDMQNRESIDTTPDWHTAIEEQRREAVVNPVPKEVREMLSIEPGRQLTSYIAKLARNNPSSQIESWVKTFRRLSPNF